MVVPFSRKEWHLCIFHMSYQYNKVKGALRKWENKLRRKIGVGDAFCGLDKQDEVTECPILPTVSFEWWSARGGMGGG